MITFPQYSPEGAPEKDPEDQDRLEPMEDETANGRSTDYHVGRNGDDASCPFECDLCIFRKLFLRDPISNSYTDNYILALFRRMNLDAFWSRETGTVEGNTARLKKGIKLLEKIGLDAPYTRDGPFPFHDHCGYRVALQVLLYSLEPGRGKNKYCTFDTVRRMRSIYTNFVRATPQANWPSLSMVDHEGHYQRFNTDISGSYFFSNFIVGVEKRMGSQPSSNQVMAVDLILAVLEKAEERIAVAVCDEEENYWTVFHTYVTVAYVISLRGSEGLLLDLFALDAYWNHSPDKVILALFGKIKGQHHVRCHLFPCVATTSSGIEVRKTVERLLALKRRQGVAFLRGFAISDVRGKPFKTKLIDEALHEVLFELFEERRHLFPEHIDSRDKIVEMYHAYRSFRRSSATRAQNMDVSPTDVDIINRWNQKEKRKGRKVGGPLRMHYADVLFMDEAFLRYTEAM
jgi:hypothetical protein